MMSVINLCVMMVSCAFYCCVSWSQAPFTPFITELMYQNLRHLIDPASVEEKDSGSIHYLMLPHVRCTALHFIQTPHCYFLSTANQKFDLSKICIFSSRLHTFSILLYIKVLFISVIKAVFSASFLQCHMTFRNH